MPPRLGVNVDHVATLRQARGVDSPDPDVERLRAVVPVATLPGMVELNIGHSIVAPAVLIGMTAAVRELKSVLG